MAGQPAQGRGRQQLMIQGQMALDYAPPVMIEHGYSDAHTWPLVSLGKDGNGNFSPSFRIHPSKAWDFPSVELRAANSWPALIFDIDGRARVAKAWSEFVRGGLPAPCWIVQRHGGGAHAVYTLEKPIHRGDRARVAPLRLAARVSEYLGEAIGADRGYNGVLSHNPTYDGMLLDGNNFYTTWWATGYQLPALAEYIPEGWRRPRMSRTEQGRNVDLFNAGMKLAGSIANVDNEVLPVLEALNAELETPLGLNEVKGIARSVERYRRRWIESGRFYSEGERMAWGTRMGRASGRARRAKTAERDRHIAYLAGQGLTQREIAKAVGLTQRLVSHVVNRPSRAVIRDSNYVLARTTQLVR